MSLMTLVLRKRCFAGALVFATLVAGCGGPTIGQPAGRVTLSGQPIVGAEMRFTPKDNAEEWYTGISGKGGQYQLTFRDLKGLPIGEYKVAITIFTLPDGTPFPPGELADNMKDAGKLKAVTYEFTQQISAGSSSLDFELTQGEKTQAAAES